MALCSPAATRATTTSDSDPSKPPKPPKPHHRANGFQNNHVDFEPKGILKLLQWKADAARQGLPKAPLLPTPVVTPDLAFIRANAVAGAAMQPAITWIGHASVLAQFGGLNVITDPIFSERASPVSFLGPKRAQPSGLALAELPRIDIVVVSHNHYDHCDEASLRALNAQAGGPPLFIVPLGVKAWLADAGISNAVELDWWQSRRVDTVGGAVDVVLTPVQHWSGRSLGDRLQTLWGGYAIFAVDFHLYYGGDTGYSADFAETKKRFAERQRTGGGFDIALLPIGGYEPRWFMRDQHLNPAEAVLAHRDLGAKRSLGVHWGTFELTDESLDEPPRALAAALKEQGIGADIFTVVAIGQTLKLPRRAAP